MSVSSSRTTVCNEVFDENSAPSEEEVLEYAARIGINPDTEPHLLPIARDGLMQALPPQWKPCFDQELGAWYYFNFSTGESRWEHPLDDVHRSLVAKGRSESLSLGGDDDSKTSIKEDLKSYEEAVSSDMISKSSDPLKGSTALRKGSLQLTPLRKSGPRGVARAESLPAATGAGDGAALWEPTSPSSPPALRTGPAPRIDIDKMDLGGSALASGRTATSRRDRLACAQEKHPRTMHGRSELTLSGGGSVFLKSNKARTPDTPDTPLVSPGQPPPFIEIVTNSDPNDPVPKSILRGTEPHPRSPQSRSLYDLDPRDMSSEEKQLWRKQELEEEQRKSVRFNLDKELDIRFQISDSEENGEEVEEEEEELEKEEWNSEDEEADEERLIAGVKVSDILNLMDASELDEPSTKDVSHLPVLPDDNFETQMQREMLCNDIGDLVDNVATPTPQPWWEGCVVVHQSCTWQFSEDTSSSSEISDSSISTSYDLKLVERENARASEKIKNAVEKSREENSSSDVPVKEIIPELVVTEAPKDEEDGEEEEEEEEEEEIEVEEEEVESETNIEDPEAKAITKEVTDEKLSRLNEKDTEMSKKQNLEDEKDRGNICGIEEKNDELKENLIAKQTVSQPSTEAIHEELVQEEVIEINDAAAVSERELDQLEEGHEGDSGKLGISATSISNLEGLRLSGTAVTEELEEKEDLEDSEDLKFSTSPAPVRQQPRLDALRHKGASSPEDESSTGGLKKDDSEQFTLSPTPVLRPLRIESLVQKGVSSLDDDSSTGGGGVGRGVGRGVERADDASASEEEPLQALPGGGDGAGVGVRRARDLELLREAERLVEERHGQVRRLREDSQRMLAAFQEQLQMNTDAAVHALEEEHAHRLAQLQEQLLGEEEAERARLHEEIAVRLAHVREQVQLQEKSLRIEMDQSLATLKKSLTAEHEAQLERHRASLEVRLEEDRQRLETESVQRIEALRLEIAESNRKLIEEVRSTLEKEGQAQAERLKEEMETKRLEVAEQHKKDLEELDTRAQALLAERLEARLQELEASALAQAAKELESRKQELLEGHKAILEQIRLDHKDEEEFLRRDHAERLEETRVRLELERQRIREREREGEEKERDKLVESARVLDKLRCEKRLLEDKYRSLKEKYIRLKTDVKLSIERRKRREGGGTTTGSETERSTSLTRTSANSAAAVVAAARAPDAERFRK